MSRSTVPLDHLPAVPIGHTAGMEGHVIVTGSSGLVGDAVFRALAAAAIPALGVDVRAGRRTSIVGDLRRLDLDAFVRGADAVVHVAALHAPHVGHASDRDFRAVNVDATERLLLAARRHGVRRFVLTSTTSVYGRALEVTDRAAWVDEQLEPAPRDIYDETKLAAERLAAAAHGDGLGTVTLRVARCFPEPPRTTVVHRLSRGVDVSDVADGFLRAVAVTDLDRHLCANVSGPRVFHHEDVADLVGDVGAALDRRVPWLRAAFAARGWALPGPIDRVHDSTLAADVLGYRPRKDVTAALDAAGSDDAAPAGGGGRPTAC
ncbi:MAG: NAD(P)-dependent oxidoreductase [Actinomycetota bacterium]|nr:NAD(P)-dependent oxidoreductase [Actinomycetota bacterium]